MSIEKSERANKKYKAIVRSNQNGKQRVLHFGDKQYGQYRDSTPLKAYKHKNHFDRKRREQYFLRHSNTKSKAMALVKERKRGIYTPKLLSHIYLW